MSPASLALALAMLAWSDDIAVVPTRGDRAHSSWLKNISGLDRPTDRTVETLRRHDLESRYRRDTENAINQLEKLARSHPEPELVYALAELSWIDGNRLDRRRKPQALDRFVDCAAYAYDFLFDPELAEGRSPTDPRFRVACELYNGGLDRLIRAAKSQGKIEPGDTIKMKVHGEEISLRVTLEHSPWTAGDFGELLMAADFEVTGLPTHNYQYGLGVPLIGVRKTEGKAEGIARFYPPEMGFALTALLRPISRLRDPAADVAEPRACELKLIDPIKYRTYGKGAAEIALESDLSTPLAYMWSRSDLNRYRWSGLLRPGEAAERAGLMLIRPYEPDKIPVVMVHGLASSPLAWVPMINELLHDPNIYAKYQFFLYLYPTGVPVPIAAAGLRDSLGQARREFDADGDGAAFNRMVLLGHSMGGLLSHAMAVDSGDRFWRINSDQPFDSILGPPAVLAELKQYLFFDAQPFVGRVVFLATPHRGSDTARGVVGRVGSNLIAEPDHISQLLAKLIRENPDKFDRRKFRKMPTSIETLDPSSPVLKALLTMAPPPGRPVAFHSIIGSVRAGDTDATTDGIVPYRSSHLDGVRSELVVRSDHGVQKDPSAIREVRRILLEHVGEAAPPAAAVAGRPPEVN